MSPKLLVLLSLTCLPARLDAQHVVRTRDEEDVMGDRYGSTFVPCGSRPVAVETSDKWTPTRDPCPGGKLPTLRDYGAEVVSLADDNRSLVLESGGKRQTILLPGLPGVDAGRFRTLLLAPRAQRRGRAKVVTSGDQAFLIAWEPRRDDARPLER